jgi:Ca2+-binding RTX toxin-like protein
MAARLTAAAFALALAWSPAAFAQQPEGPYAPWDGSSPFNCVLQDAGTGTTVPDPGADPYCVEFDKTQQNVTELGILEFLANEPGRVAAASPKCFYYQSDHWTGSVTPGGPELWHWDGQYFFDKAIGAGGVNLQNFRVAGQAADPSDYGEVPTAFAPYVDQGGGGGYVVGDVPADPNCAALVDTPAERNAIYSGGQPPPLPPTRYRLGPCAKQNTVRGSASADELIGGPYGDRLIGLRGNDLLRGAGGGDCLRGQRGKDRLRGGRGRDKLRGGPGNDVVFAADGRRDWVRCGPGRDVVSADPRDRVRGCELTGVATP